MTRWTSVMPVSAEQTRGSHSTPGASTSRSRADRDSSSLGEEYAPGSGRLANSRIRRRVMPGSSRASPSARVRIAARSSSGAVVAGGLKRHHLDARDHSPTRAPARQHDRQPRSGSDPHPPRPAPRPFSRPRDHPPDEMACVALVCAATAPRSDVAPAPQSQRACPRPEDRPPAATHLVSHPSSCPCGQAGNNAP